MQKNLFEPLPSKVAGIQNIWYKCFCLGMSSHTNSHFFAEHGYPIDEWTLLYKVLLRGLWKNNIVNNVCVDDCTSELAITASNACFCLNYVVTMTTSETEGNDAETDFAVKI